MRIHSNALFWFPTIISLVHMVSSFAPSLRVCPSSAWSHLDRTENLRLPLVVKATPSTSGTSTIFDQNQGSSSEAQESLERLIQRQKTELEQNERLLKILTGGHDGTKAGLDKESGDEEMSSLAASLISGFDYGFVSRSEGATLQLKSVNETSFQYSMSSSSYKGPPENLLALGIDQLQRNWNAIQGEYRDEDDQPNLSIPQLQLRDKLDQLTLNSTEIWQKEYAYYGGSITAPLIIKLPYLAVCFLLDEVFEGRYVPSRFYLLETVARMPYFSYITMLHLYETLGFWRRSTDIKRIHFAEELNEYQHLLIMESLGGDQPWWVRFVAQHASIVYYGVLLVLWAVSPSLSYQFSELLETHAVNTYSVLLEENEELLKELPPSKAAIDYYSSCHNDPFYAEFQTTALSMGQELRRPGYRMVSLYDVFSAIRADEADHVGTMQSCLDPQAALRSASLEKRFVTALALASIVAAVVNSGEVALPEEMERMLDQVTVTITDSTGLEAIVAGVGGLAQKLLQDDSSEGNLLEVGSDLAESGPVVASEVRRAIILVLEALGSIFSRFI